MDKEKNKQYQSILNNLLDVSPNDTAVFCRVNNKTCFDFYSLFGSEAFNYIYLNKNFDIPILEVNLLRISQEINECDNFEGILEILKFNNIEISNAKITLLKKDIKQAKEIIISDLKASFQKQAVKWKIFLNKANEINTETNIWPMHLGFFFVKTSIEGKSIYAPLFLKEVYIEIRNARPFLVSNGDIKINEKLLFLLTNAGFDLDLSDNFGDWSIKELIKYLNNVWGQIYQLNLNINQKFKNIDSELISNKSLDFEPGIVLGLFQPSGGYVRNRMLEIIENNELNKIIDIEFNKNIYKKRINDTIYNPKTSIFKITPTNFSQDKAIASSLNQNTIIWGPPGTGKSQTIVNILTNLLVYGKTSLVCSQKKAALEVIRNRMGALQPFCLFMLNSKNMNKKSFYAPLKEYLYYLENFDEKDSLKPLRIINYEDLNFVNNIGTISSDSRFLEATKIIAKIHNTFECYTSEFWEKIVNLPRNIKYPESFEFEYSKQLLVNMLKLNKVRFKPHKKLNRDIKKVAKTLFNDFKHYQGNLNEILAEVKTLKADDYDYLINIVNILPKNNLNQVSDENELKKFVAKSIINKVSSLNADEKAEYIEFAATIRLGNLEPYKFIKKFPNMIKKLFPVVIVTPDADLSAWKKEEFDYSILDESSQIFLEKGLPVLYLSKIKILAGDDKQMKPSNWFGVRVSDEESIYGKVDSLLDFAKSLGVYSVLLDKNYRSNYAALMTFSSKYFYESTLDVIDSANSEVNYKPIEVIQANGQWEDNKNIAEAALAIKLAYENLNKYGKIIILCFNAKQQDFITANIFKNFPELEKAVNDQTLLLRNIENIQGDEADLVIVSVAYDYKTSIHSTYVGRPGGMNALNVAVSRAKDKMIVIKSINAEDVNVLTNNEDAIIFKRWLEFLELSDADRKNFLAHNKNNLETEKTDLSLEIKNTLIEATVDKNFLELAENEVIGTLQVDYVIKKNNKPAICFVVDNYAYANKPEDFIMSNDLCNFIRSKNYTVYKLDRILWEVKKDEIIGIINSYEDLREEYIANDVKKEDDIEVELSADVAKLFDEKDYKTDVIENNSKINVEQVDNNTILQDEEKTITVLIGEPENNIEVHKLPVLRTKKMLVNLEIIEEEKFEIPREIKQIASFDDMTKEWTQILSQEIYIGNENIKNTN
ncbi:DEAD/DEAH box helicase [Mycoplasmopsis felifaucium]|uniref:DEAD/DEAH box helicase n=1 Tax=Mycoplasmopsis felifaucium TaxID=35768 RepID=UPI000484C050|nr:DEAD/DEAH box helicase [Mycoplasmopsis felifaucium]